MNVFNLTEEYLQLMQDIEECDGILTPELEERLQVNQDNLEAKVKGYHHIMQIAKGDIATIDDEIERLTKIKTSKANLIERFKAVLLMVTQVYGYTGKSGNKKLDFDTVKMYTVNKESLMIADEEHFADETWTKQVVSLKLSNEELAKVADALPDIELKTTRTILRAELTKYLKEGEIVEGTTLIEKPYIVIK